MDAIVVNSAGCGSAMKEYRELLADDPALEPAGPRRWPAKVRDLSEFLAELRPGRAARHPLDLTVAYHDACHLAHAQRITAAAARPAAPRSPGCGWPSSPTAAPAAARPASTTCSSPRRPASSATQGGARSLATGAPLVVSANPGCSLQIASAHAPGRPGWPLAHIAEVLDASLRGLPVSSLTD